MNYFRHFFLAALLLMCTFSAWAYDFEADGIRYDITSHVVPYEVSVVPNYYSGDIIIPEAVMYEGKNYSVTSIEFAAFSDCTSLTSVTIGNSVTSIGSKAFFGCTSLTSVTIPNSVTSIESSAFSYCMSLTSVAIPNSVTSVGYAAFRGCKGLTTVTIGNSVTIIKESTFYGCTSLTSVTIPNSVTSIRSSAFRGCTSLTSVTLPNSVTIIGNYAFGCISLASVTIPKSVTRIGEGAFEDCTRLASVTVEATTPPSIGSNTFPSQDIQLFVPCGCKKDYQDDLDWGSGFSSIIETVFPFALEVVSNNVSLGSTSIVQLPRCENYFAIVQAEPIEGHAFLGWMIDGVMVSTANPYTFVVDRDVEIVGCFSGTGVEEDGVLQVSVSPNPAQSFVNIECENMRNIAICTMDGRVSRKYDIDSEATTLDLADLPKGVYVLRIELYDGAVISRKIVKE